MHQCKSFQAWPALNKRPQAKGVQIPASWLTAQPKLLHFDSNTYSVAIRYLFCSKYLISLYKGMLIQNISIFSSCSRTKWSDCAYSVNQTRFLIFFSSRCNTFAVGRRTLSHSKKDYINYLLTRDLFNSKGWHFQWEPSQRYACTVSSQWKSNAAHFSRLSPEHRDKKNKPHFFSSPRTLSLWSRGKRQHCKR